MTTPHPDSPLALSRASLWRHMKRVWKDLVKNTEEQLIETSKNLGILFGLSILLGFFPLSVPLIAWIRRAKDRKYVRQWDRTVKKEQDTVWKNLER